MPSFRAKFEASLRSSEQGADTVIWLATRPDDTLLENGAFYFDRSVAKKHLPLAGTQVSLLARVLQRAIVVMLQRC
jgi:dehydrogenase/reductase SDR family protein 12